MRRSVRVSVETEEQFKTACELPGIDGIYVDAGLFAVSSFGELVKAAHKGKGGIGKKIWLRLPHIWREKSEKWSLENGAFIREAGFDGYLCRNVESVLWLSETVTEPGEITLDHTVYVFNAVTDGELELLTGIPDYRKTFSLELNFREIAQLKENGHPAELVVYGRAPLMVSAQCIRRTSLRCDRREGVLYLKDRTGAMMPVKNTCRFCYNTVYNSVPTVLYDLEDEVEKTRADAIRYEFTTETAAEMKNILAGTVPKNYTRGHFHRGVE